MTPAGAKAIRQQAMMDAIQDMQSGIKRDLTGTSPMYQSIYEQFGPESPFSKIVNSDMINRGQGPGAIFGAKPSDPSTYSKGYFDVFENRLKDQNVQQEILDLLRNLPTTTTTVPGAFGTTTTKETLDVMALVTAIEKLQIVNKNMDKTLKAMNAKTD